MTYTFDAALQKELGDDSDVWVYLLQHVDEMPIEGLLFQKLNEAGFDSSYVAACLQELVSKSTDDLVMTALESGSCYHPAAYAIQMRTNGSDFDAACQLCRSPKGKERKLGVALLKGVLGNAHVAAARTLVIDMAQTEQDEEVQEQIAYALYHLHVSGRSKYLERMASATSNKTRESVALSLCECRDNDAIRVLITLSKDSDVSVRNWATFGLQRCGENSEEVREALKRRLSDDSSEIRQEAMLGLAVRKDENAFEPLAEALRADEVTKIALEGATAMKDARLVPILEELKLSCSAEHTQLIQNAIKACLPKGK